ncbi:alpha/beta-hydrolase [Lactarius hatsudake]|nr:alpha/beta-hydrolase [Lactarius hatsudake]
MYDKTPVYPHQQHLTWAHEPYKSLYVSQRLFTTLLLVPLWAIYYAILPRSFRPRPSWSITQIIVVKFTKRISKVTEVAGVTWGTRDPTQEPDETSLNETRFAWVPPLPDELRTGVVDDNEVQCLRVGTFIWPRVPSPAVRMRGLLQGGGGSAAKNPYPPRYIPDNVPVPSKFSVDDCITASSTPASQYNLPKISELDAHLPEVLHSNGDADVEAAAFDSPPHMIGIYLHGGGYCHMSAHESSGTSRIPRRLMKDNLFEEIHAVEYRLLQHAPIPGALQDAAAVYAHLVTHHLGARKGPDGKYHYPNPSIPYHKHAPMSTPLHDTASATFSPSVDQALDCKTRFNNVTLQPGTVASPVADAEHRQHFETIPGHHERSDSVDPSGNLVLALSRWIRDEGVLPVPDGMLLLSPSCDPSHTLPQVPASRRPRPHADTDYLLDTPEPRALLSRTFLGHHPVEMVYSPYVSPASEWVLSVFHGVTEGMVDLEPLGPHKDSRDYRDEGIKTYDCVVNGDPRCPDVRTPASNPFIRLPPGMGLFTEFPRAMIVVGDAERLEREVVALERALEYDGVRVRMVWAKDAVHDILIMGAWDERVREGVWKEIGKWVREVVAE